MRTVAIAFALAVACPALAGPLIPPGAWPDLDAAIARQERQFYHFNAYELGLSLDYDVKDAAARAKIDAFLAQDAVDDFQAFAGVHHQSLMSGYGEHGDLGFFGGVAMAGTAFRYVALKREGAPADALARARAAVVRAAESWHVFYVVTGGNGVVARGIARLVPENPSDPSIPEASSWVATPLHDGSGPLPRPKDNGTFRADNSGGVLPAGTWGWIDSASKDQVSGQVLGMVSLYEAMRDDPDIDQSLVARLADDARGIAHVLMTKRQILGMEGVGGEGEYDLIIMDADGRPTMYHDLNPLSVEKMYLPEGSPGFNVFNLFLGIGVMKGLWHVTGDPDIERFVYEEMLGNRDYLGKAAAFDGPDAIDYIYMGLSTNTDDPDMTGVGLFLTLFTENDPAVTSVFRRFLEDGWWAPPGEPRFRAAKSKQPLWHAIYLALSDRGPHDDVAADLAGLLAAFPLGPYWNDARVNCDAGELAKGECLAVDGKTVIQLQGADPQGNPLALEALDPSIRPCSNFNARSNPFGVNGGAVPTLLDPGGDLLAAYWIARALDAKPAGEGNTSRFVRSHMPVGGAVADPGAEAVEVADAAEPMPDVVVAEVDALAEGSAAPDAARPSSGGGCDAGGAPVGAWWALGLLVVAAAGLRRRDGSRYSPITLISTRFFRRPSNSP